MGKNLVGKWTTKKGDTSNSCHFIVKTEHLVDFKIRLLTLRRLSTNQIYLLIMRTIIFLFLVVCLGTQSQAKDKLPVTKVQTIVMPMADIIDQSEINTQGYQTAARFFKVKNARIKQALKFRPGTKKTLFA